MRSCSGSTAPNDRARLPAGHPLAGRAWGYFPTYTLGAMTAAQLFEAALLRRAGDPRCARRGDFAPLRAWLRANVHGKAACSRPTTSSPRQPDARSKPTCSAGTCGPATWTVPVFKAPSPEGNRAARDQAQLRIVDT